MRREKKYFDQVFIFPVLSLISVFLLGGCGTLRTITSYSLETADKIASETNDNISKSVDKAIGSLDTNSADWQLTLKQLQSDLNASATDRIDQISNEGQKVVQVASDEAGKRVEQASEEARKRIEQVSEESRKRVQQISSETNFLISRGIAQTGTELRCNADFVGKRMGQRLKELKNKLLFGKGDITLNPAFCQVVPDVLDLRIAPQDRPANIQFYGYDFFDDRALANRNSPLIRVTTRNTQGQQTSDLTHLMALTTHYLLTFKIAELQPDALCALKDQKIVIETLAGISLGELNIVCPLPAAPTPTPSPTPQPTPTPTPIPPADLVIVEWNLNNRTPVIGEQVTARARVRNIGAGPAGKFVLRWTHNADSENINIQDRKIEGLAAGAEILVDFIPVTYRTQGARNTSISVDAENGVAESNEGNNNSNIISMEIRPIPPRFLTVVANRVEHYHEDDDTLSSNEKKTCTPSLNESRIEYFPNPRTRSWTSTCTADSTDGSTKVTLTLTPQSDGSVNVDGEIEVEDDGGGRRTTSIVFTITGDSSNYGKYRVDDGKGGYATVTFSGMRVIK